MWLLSDQAERLTSQAASLGTGELTRAAEVIAAGLTDMPRSHRTAAVS